MNMQSETKANNTALVTALLIHSIIFMVCCYFNVFAMVSPNTQERPVDVMIYDSAAGNSGSASSGEAGSAGSDDIVIKETVHLPELVQSYKQATAENHAVEVRKQENNNQSAAVQNDSPNTASTAGNNSAGDGQSAQGNGTGDTGGAGQAAGDGNGNGENDGNGEGRDAEAAMRPKSPPRLLSAAQAVYPQEMRNQGSEGSSVIRILVGTSGQVEGAELVSSSGYGELDEAAMNAVYNYSFSPALNVYGEPVRCYVRRTIVFRLN